MELSQPVKEVLSTNTLEEFIAATKKHKGFMVSAHEAMALNTHKTYLYTKKCREESKGNVTAFAKCLIERISKIGED